MYQNCCKKCGSADLYTEVKGTNTGLYCSDCGAYQKWLGKDELRAFKHTKTKKTTKNSVTINKLDKASEELSEELDLAYEIFNEAFAKENKTELEKKALHFAGMIMQTHDYLLDR